MARSFGNGGDYIEIGTNTVFDDNIFTVAFRWRMTAAGQWEIVSKHQAATSFNGWGFSSNNGSPNRMHLAAKPGSGAGWSCVDATVNATDGGWHSAVGRINRTASGTIDLMVDGTSTAQTASGAFDPTGQVLRLGRSIDSFWASPVGDLEDFAFWNVRLTADEARAFCSGAAPGAIRPDNLKVWLPLGD